jgi:Zn-dependent peptidase ImmA (M78 family)
MRPTYNLLEEYIMKMYHSIGIYHPHQLDNEDISSRLGMVLVYMPAKSFNVENLIVLDERNSDTEQWQDFGHELCHALMHIGNQNRMPLPFRLYQEWKASSFSLHACIPTFMLDKMELPESEAKAVNMIHETFGVEYSFAKKRLDQYIRNKMCIS